MIPYTQAMLLARVLVNPAQLAELNAEIRKVIHPELDSVRFYRLGSNYQTIIEVIGRTAPIESGRTASHIIGLRKTSQYKISQKVCAEKTNFELIFSPVLHVEVTPASRQLNFVNHAQD